MFCVCCIVIGSGCAAWKHGTTSHPSELEKEQATTRPSRIAQATNVDEHSISLPVQPSPVAQGPAPLVYLYSAGGPVRIVDLTTNAQVAAGVAPQRTLVRVDAKNGVILGRETLAPGPLVASHTYGIFIDSPEPVSNTYRSETIRGQ
jgi:hypothetical protein